MKGLQIFIVLSLISIIFAAYDITQYGAVPHSDTISDQFKNQRAILAAIKDANKSENDRVIRIPSKTFYSMPIRV